VSEKAGASQFSEDLPYPTSSEYRLSVFRFELSRSGVVVMFYAALCGIFGSLASVMGKIAFSDNQVLSAARAFCAQDLGLQADTCQAASTALRLLCFGLMLACNATMVAFYLRALAQNASVVATVGSTAVNYLVTGATGWLLFRESVGSSWLLGSLFISTGLCLIAMSQDGPQRREKP
jgi:drug/metabolite transporter (DMT)-like permease